MRSGGNRRHGSRAARSGIAAPAVRLLAALVLVADAACLGPFSVRGQGGSEPSSIEFLTDLERAERLSTESGKPVLLVFGAPWCASCRVFERDTLPSPAVQEMGGDFHWVFVNVDREATLARRFGVTGTPQFFVLGRSGEPLGRALGSLPPREFRHFLDGALARAEARTPAADVPELVKAEDLTLLTPTPHGYRGASICYSNVGYGPFDVPSQSPAAILRLSPRPRTPSTLARDQTEVRWNENLTNFWAYEPGEYRLDFGALTSTLAVAHGLSDSVEIEIELFDFRRFGSELDFITNAFHDLFGLDDSGRDDFPSRENVIEVDGVSSVDDSTYSEDVAVTLQHNVTCGTEDLPAFSYAFTAKTNLGGNIPVGGGTDLSLGFSTAASRRLGKSYYGYLGLSYIWHGRDEWRGLPLEQTQYSALLAGEWRYAPRKSWILQYLLTEAASADVAPFDDATHEFNLGWKGEVGLGVVLEISLIENAFVLGNSPDFGFHFGLSQRL